MAMMGLVTNQYHVLAAKDFEDCIKLCRENESDPREKHWAIPMKKKAAANLGCILAKYVRWNHVRF